MQNTARRHQPFLNFRKQNTYNDMPYSIPLRIFLAFISMEGMVTLTVLSVIVLYIHYRLNRDDPNLAVEDIINRKETKTSTSSSSSTRKYVNWRYTEKRCVKTSYGDVHIVVKRSHETCRRHFLTYHDVASNSSVCFDAMFAHMDDSLGLCVYHVYAPGHFEESKKLNESYKYPSIKELGDQVQEVLRKMKTGPMIFVGVGAGARILTRVAIETPELVRGLVLISPTFREAGVWEKIFNFSIKYSNAILENLTLTRHFNPNVSNEIVQQVRDALQNISTHSILKFWDTFTNRTQLDDYDIAILQEFYIMLVVGHNKAFWYSGPNYFSDALELRKKLSPKLTTMIQFDRSGPMVSEEIPGELAANLDSFIAAFA